MPLEDQVIPHHLSMSNKVTNKKNIEIFKQDINRLSYEESISVLETILSKIQDDLFKLKIRKQFEKGWPKVQALAKMAGYKVSKKMQDKGKTFRYDLKK